MRYDYGVFGRITTIAPPSDLTLAVGIDDLWTLVRVPVTPCSAVLPHRLVDGANRLSSDGLFEDRLARGRSF